MGSREKFPWTALFSRRRGTEARRRLTFATSVIALTLGYWFLGRTPAEPSGRPIPFEPERIVTATDGPVTLTYGPSELTIDTGARVVVPGGGVFFEREVFLSRGRITARVKRLGHGQEFSVRTPVAVAGVRGTEFSVALIHGGARALVSVVEGAVLIQSIAGDSAMLGAGRSASVDAGDPPVLRDRFTEEEIREMIFAAPTAPAAAPEPVFQDATIADPRPVLPEPAANPVSVERQAYDPSRSVRGLEANHVDPTQVNPANPQPVNPQPRSYR